MISFVIAYYNRKELFINTLNSFLFHGYNRKEIEVIVVDDASNDQNRLEDVISDPIYSGLRIRLFRNEPNDKWYMNPSVPYNQAVKHAKGDILVIQNPECFHVDGLIDHIEMSLRNRHYMSFSCYSLDKSMSSDIVCSLSNKELKTYIQDSSLVSFEGNEGWYNHSRFRPVGYHFAAAMRKSVYMSIGGFNETLAKGIGYDDDAFMYALAKNEIDIEIVDQLSVVHQWHYTEMMDVDMKHYYQTYNRILYKYVICHNLDRYRFIILAIRLFYPVFYYIRFSFKSFFEKATKNIHS